MDNSKTKVDESKGLAEKTCSEVEDKTMGEERKDGYVKIHTH